MAWYQGQQALARLSQTCQLLCLVARPILFHWYHAGNGRDEAREFRRLAAFVLATLHYPGLAAAVKSLALHSPRYDPNMRMGDEMSKVRVTLKSDATYRRTKESLGGYLLHRHVLDTAELQELALAYLPNVSELSLQRNFHFISECTNIIDSQINPWLEWTYPLPALRHLVIPGQLLIWPFPRQDSRTTIHIQDVESLLHCAPNTETLIFADSSGGSVCRRVFFQDDPWDVWLLRLRRLSINGIGVQELARIVALCPALEDIEFFDAAKPPELYACSNTLQVRAGVLEPAKHLGSTRTTLKRLCYTVMYSPGWRYESKRRKMIVWSWRGTSPQWVPYLPTGFSTGLSFAEFPALERLEVEQLMLYGPLLIRALESEDAVRDEVALRLAAPWDLRKRLPPNLVRLRLGGVVIWSVVLRDMIALCSTGPGGRMYCPYLEMVDLVVSTAPPESEYRYLVEVMAERGVRVSLSHASASLEAVPRGMLPPRPGAPSEMPVRVKFGRGDV